MAITKAAILTFCNAQLKRAETDIDAQIQIILNDLSDNDLLIGTDITQTLVSTGKTLNYPTGYKKIKSIVLNDGTYDIEPLLRISYQEYLSRRACESASETGEPDSYAEWNKKFYVYPVADGAYTSKIEFCKFHSQDVNTIEFGDEFTNALNFGTTAFVALKLKLMDYANIWLPMYQAEKQKKIDNVPNQPVIMKYKDLG